MRAETRPMTVADTARVAEVHVRAWQAAYRDVMPAEYLAGLSAAERAAMWRAAIENDRPGCRDVISVDGEVVGFAAYGGERDGDDPARGELYAINLDPDHWRRGLGRQLLRHVTAELGRLGYTSASLWVEANNDRARRFYEVEGWQFDGTERSDVEFGVTIDELRYARRLTPPPET